MHYTETYTTIILEEVESTNAYALSHIESFDDKTVICAKNQTSGRGRYSRKWISDGSENVYMTIVLKPKDNDNYPFSNLTQYLSVVLCRYLKNNFDINPQIKWPNDILIDGCKISGILAESCAKDGKISAIALGLGLNVNLKAETLDLIDQKATSLSFIKGKNFDSEKIASEIVKKFFDGYDNFVKLGFKSIKDEYVSLCGFLGKEISVREAGEKVKYTALSVDDDGLLTVKDSDNKISKLITGDVLC